MSEDKIMFRSTRARLGDPATVQVSSAIHASGTLTEISPDGRGAVEIDDRSVRGAVIPSVRRLNLHELDQSKTEKDDPHDVPSPC